MSIQQYYFELTGDNKEFHHCYRYFDGRAIRIDTVYGRQLLDIGNRPVFLASGEYVLDALQELDEYLPEVGIKYFE